MSAGSGGRKLGPSAGVPSAKRPMTTPSDPKQAPGPARAKPGAVLDPAWEEALRRGQVADGGAGSVEAELAVVHLLRHARAPEGLDAAAEDRLWSEVSAAVTPTPWWRRRWLWVGLAPAAAAAVVVLAVRVGGPTEDVSVPQVAVAPARKARPASDALAAPASAEETPVAELAQGGRSPTARTLEQQFATLAPPARARVAAAVGQARAQTRARLLGRFDPRSAGGAP